MKGNFEKIRSDVLCVVRRPGSAADDAIRL